LEQAERNRQLEQDAFRFCVQKVKEKGLNMKLVKTEVLLDRSKVLFYFTAEKRVDFVNWCGTCRRVKDADRDEANRVRDEAKMVCGLGGAEGSSAAPPF